MHTGGKLRRQPRSELARRAALAHAAGAEQRDELRAALLQHGLKLRQLDVAADEGVVRRDGLRSVDGQVQRKLLQ